jgi:putative nucleotidyltransferase with HDIG domain
MSYDIRDPIYGFIHPNEEERKIIDTKVLQRLKRIKQLALANLVYPGANHTRFEHSLGVMHLAGLIAEQLRIDPDKKEIVRLAALLHDIGHGPFSHVSEDVMKNLSENIEIHGKINFHETITCKIIEQDKVLRKLIAQEECKKISSLIKERYEENYLKEIISGPLDADKMDYLLRDSYHCGVKYGIYDYHQLIKSIVAESAEPKDKHDLSLMIHEDGIRAFEQFLLAKYYIATQVYRHKIRLITDMMIVRAIKLGVEVDKVDFLKEIYIYRDSPEYIKEYLK